MGDAQGAEGGERPVVRGAADELCDVVRVLVVEMPLDGAGPARGERNAETGFNNTVFGQVRARPGSISVGAALLGQHLPVAEAGGPEVGHFAATVVIGVPVDVPDTLISDVVAGVEQTVKQQLLAPMEHLVLCAETDSPMRVRPPPAHHRGPGGHAQRRGAVEAVEGDTARGKTLAGWSADRTAIEPESVPLQFIPQQHQQAAGTWLRHLGPPAEPW